MPHSKSIERLLRRVARLLPLRIEVRRRLWSPRKERDDRFIYQRRHVHFGIGVGAEVLDVGGGGFPFPLATVLVDRYLEATPHRADPLRCNGKPLVQADVLHLPFQDHAFDFAYCSHVLEHVEDPIQACSELMRVAQRGYIETPNYATDALFSWAMDMHRWHVVAIADRLCFFEYDLRQLRGVGSQAWSKIILSSWSHPLQDMFWDNQDIFNVMFTWRREFRVSVFRLDGSLESLTSGSRSDPARSRSEFRCV